MVKIIQKCPLTMSECGKKGEIAKKRQIPNTLYIVLSHQFKSDLYDTQELQAACRDLCNRAQELLHGMALEFKVLEAGFGSHLFCPLCESIQLADIAICELSTENSNVYLEYGLAIGTDTLMLPIKKKTGPTPASDISGIRYLVWTTDPENRIVFDPGAAHRLAELVENSLIKRREQWSPITISAPKTKFEPSQVIINFGKANLELNGRIGKVPERFLNIKAVILQKKHLDQIGATEGTLIKIINEKNSESTEAYLYGEPNWIQSILGLSSKVRKALDINIIDNGTEEGTIGSRMGHKFTLIVGE